jgi:hypothetical protein
MEHFRQLFAITTGKRRSRQLSGARFCQRGRAVALSAAVPPLGPSAVRVSCAAYRSRPSGRLGAGAVNFFRNAWLRSLRASLAFRSRWKRALSPVSADMVT